MKMNVLMVAALAFVSFSAQAKTVSGVTICSATCQSEVLGSVSHDKAFVGKIYYASATEDHKTNSNVCMTHSMGIQVVSNRLNGLSLKACMDALNDKYRGKTVDLITDAESSGDDSDLGSYFAIIER